MLEKYILSTMMLIKWQNKLKYFAIIQENSEDETSKNKIKEKEYTWCCLFHPSHNFIFLIYTLELYTCHLFYTRKSQLCIGIYKIQRQETKADALSSRSKDYVKRVHKLSKIWREYFGEAVQRIDYSLEVWQWKG